MFKRFLLKLWIRLKEIFALYYSDIFCLRIADFTEDETEWAVDDCSRGFFYIESFLTLSPDNSSEDLSQCCFYFPMTLSFFLVICSLILTCQTLWRATKLKGMEAMLTWMILMWIFKGGRKLGLQVLINAFHRIFLETCIFNID